MITGDIGGFEVGLDGGERSFNFVRGVSDKKFLRIVGFFDGFNSFFGKISGNDEDDEFGRDSSTD